MIDNDPSSVDSQRVMPFRLGWALLAAVALGAILCCCLTGYGTGFMLDVRNTGFYPSVGAADLQLVNWVLPLNERVNATPTWAAGKLYVTTLEGSLYCLGDDGSLLWSVPLGGKIHATPYIAPDGSVLVGTCAGQLYRVSSTGRILWDRRIGSAIVGSATGNGNLVFQGTWDGDLVCLSLDGVLLWTYRTAYPINSTPAVDPEGRVVIGSMDRSVHCITSLGEAVWQYQTGDAVMGSPSIDTEGNVYFGSYDCYLYSLSSSGRLRWRFETANQIYSTPAIDQQGRIYCTFQDGSLYVLSSNGDLIWEHPGEACILSSPVIDSTGKIYLGGMYGDGVWLLKFGIQQPTGYSGIDHERFYAAHPVFSQDGRVFVVSLEGTVYCLGTPYSPPPLLYTPGDYLEVGTSVHAIEETDKGIVALDWMDGAMYSVSLENQGAKEIAKLPSILYDLVVEDSTVYSGFAGSSDDIQGYDLATGTPSRLIPVNIELDWPNHELWGIEIDGNTLYLLSPAPTPQELIAYDRSTGTTQGCWTLPGSVTELIGLEQVGDHLFTLDWGSGRIYRIEIEGATARLREFLDVSQYIPRADCATGGFRGIHFGDEYLYVTTISGHTGELSRIHLLRYSSTFDADTPE